MVVQQHVNRRNYKNLWLTMREITMENNKKVIEKYGVKLVSALLIFSLIIF